MPCRTTACLRLRRGRGRGRSAGRGRARRQRAGRCARTRRLSRPQPANGGGRLLRELTLDVQVVDVDGGRDRDLVRASRSASYSRGHSCSASSSAAARVRAQRRVVVPHPREDVLGREPALRRATSSGSSRSADQRVATPSAYDDSCSVAYIGLRPNAVPASASCRKASEPKGSSTTWWSSSKPALSPSHMPELAEAPRGQSITARQPDVLVIEPAQDVADPGRSSG